MRNRIIALCLCVVMIFGTLTVLTSCGDKNKGKGEKPDALVIMTENLDGLFNPFFSTSAADGTIVSMTQIGMLTTGTNSAGEVEVAFGDNEAVVVKDFISEYNPDEVGDNPDKEGVTTYTFVIKNGVKYSDGTPLTIEDVLFNMYVYLDPVYTGSSTMYSTDIIGLSQYRTQQEVSGNVDSDSLINSQARTRAENRILELINLYKDTKGNGSEATYEQMVAAIKTHSLSYGYTSAISTDATKVSWKDLLADYERALELFKKELNTDFDSAKEAYTEKPYSEHEEFKNEVFCFLYYEGHGSIDVKFKKVNGKEDKSKIESISYNYPSHIDTREEAIEYIYQDTINMKLDQILRYWATAQELTSEYTAKAKEVILRENMTDGELVHPNILGIVSLGHTSDVANVTIGENTYNVAHEHNPDGTPKNSGEYDVLQVKINGVDPKAVWNFAFSVAPQHYYAEGYTVDIPNNNFGVEYASTNFMTTVIQSTRNVKVPVGAGAYQATDSNNSDNPDGTKFFSNNVVYFKANNNFLLGAPKIEKIRYQVVSATNALDALETGSVHYVTPQLTTLNQSRLDGLKSKGFESIAVDQLGYGYIGINAGKVPNIYLRKAIMAAMDTSLALQYYSANSAQRIYWPMSTVSWAYPKDEQGKNQIGNTEDYPAINWTESYARENIQEYMEKAADHNGGYTQSDLKVTFTIAGSNLTDHPTYLVFQTAAALLNSMGWDVEVIADTQALTKLSTGSLAVWAAAWGTTVDPDMYQVYHKNSTATSVYAWGYREILSQDYYSIEQDILDELSEYIDDARETDNRADRTEIYKDAMALVLDLAVELPVYQRKNLYAYNANVIKKSSLPEECNPYTSPLDRIWEIEFAN